LYVSENKNGIFTFATIVGSPVSSTTSNDGASCITTTGKYLFFTSCGRDDAQGKSCDIYFTKRISGNWDKPRNLGKAINSPSIDWQPCLAADGRTLYFASTRLGGYGGSDIYVTRLGDDGVWSEPENLGATVNTPYDEQRPFMHPDEKTLYFSSKGHPGMGNQDFYYSKKDENGKWTEPVNLGYPINTSGDEIGIYITTDGNTAYIGSERSGGFGGMDIYSFAMDMSNKPQHVTYIKGHIFDEQTKAPILATLELFDLSDSSGKRYSATTSDEKTGEFLTTLPYGRDYACAVNKEGYLFYSGNFTLKDFKGDEPYKLDVYLKKVEIGKSVVLNNIFFEVSKFELREESKAELSTLVNLMKKNATMKIEVSGHTDNSGDEKENKILSESRAKSVADYLISQGIEASRITYKGYGSSKPIASNSTDAGKQQNRRTEFVVTGM
ncbi:MAG TPA: OmpA family protein, partial [Chitinophagales bacterium]